MVARNLSAHHWLVEQLQARRVKREYIAITRGVVTAGRTIETGIGRHPRNRKKMSVQSGGKAAITHFQVARKFAHHSLVRVQLETGRTHQIRVHMAHINYPLLGDSLYGTSTMGDPMFLHAARLSFLHPATSERLEFRSPVPF